METRCARLTDGRVTCWGAGGAAVGPAATARASCALLSEGPGEAGALWCWGEGVATLAGAATSEASRTPGHIADDVLDLALVPGGGCLLWSDGQVSCFGFVVAALSEALTGPPAPPPPARSPYGDGRASERIATHLADWLEETAPP